MTKIHLLSLHGIRTRGVWQKTLTPLLGARNIIHHPIDYGWVSVPSLVLSAALLRKSSWFAERYDEIVGRLYPGELPSIVAHSFGTFLLGWAALQYEHIAFANVILCGSILPCDFPWATLFARGQVRAVLNESGGRDIWVRLASRLVPRCGTSGADGFSALDPTNVEERRFPLHKHSDFFSEGHVRSSWIPFILASRAAITLRCGSDVASEAEFRAIAQQGHAIDEQVFRGIEGIAGASPSIENNIALAQAQPECYTFAFDENKRLVGYVCAPLVRPEAVKSWLRKGLNGTALSLDMLATLRAEDVVMVVIAIAVAPTRSFFATRLHDSILMQLLYSVEATLSRLALQKRVIVRRIYAAAWTEEGTRLCRDVVGMNPIEGDGLAHPVYEVRVGRTPRARFGPLARLARIYQDLGVHGDH